MSQPVVRAKFKLDRVEATMMQRSEQQPDGSWKPAPPVELRTLVFSPVCSNDPGSENRKFWDATPSGQVQLGCVNPEAWARFKLGREYYLDFSPAAPAE